MGENWCTQNRRDCHRASSGVAFELAVSDERIIEEAAMITRRNIIECQSNSDNVPFPPTTSWLLSEERQPPNLLRDFLSHVVSGKSHTHLSEKSQRFVSSCSQDIYYAVTNGQWVMPKHILLAMTVHLLTGSVEIITILNRFGHCQSYSRTLELETAMCRSVTDNSSHLPPSISTDNNVIVHLYWDNFDLNEETPSGTGTTHTAHGIIVQEVEDNALFELDELPQVAKSHARTVQPEIQELPPCFAKAKAEPHLNVTRSTPGICDSNYSGFSDFLWLLCRKESSTESQIVPSWAGWLSLTFKSEDSSEAEHRCLAVDYMAPGFFQSQKTQQSSIFWRFHKRQQKMLDSSLQL